MDRASLSDLYKVGTVIAGRYSVTQVLGAGGMGVVVAARHTDLDTLVAIKMLRREVLDNRDVVARFAAEARAAVRIKSEHVARVTDVGTLPDGAPYMVMEHLDGSDLAAVVEQRGPLPVEETVDYVLQACEAIAEAHGLGIVHRDLKPGNLFLSRRPDGSELVKVLDFGISKLTDGGTGAAGSLTATTAIVGSPTYMSPEQLSSSKTVDQRTDIWSLGVILHQILSGELPFRADTLPELFFAIVQNVPTPLSELRHNVPRGLEAVVARCLAKDRNQRFANVGELALALAPFAPPRSRTSVERIVRLAPGSSGTGAPLTHTATATAGSLAPYHTPVALDRETQGTWGQTAAKPKRGASTKVVIAVGLLSVAAGAAFAVRKFGPSGLVTSAPGPSAALATASAPPAQAAAPVVIPTLAAPVVAAEPAPTEPIEPLQLPPAALEPGLEPGERRVFAPVRPRGAAHGSRPRSTATPFTESAPPPPPRPSAPAPTPAKAATSDWEEDRR